MTFIEAIKSCEFANWIKVPLILLVRAGSYVFVFVTCSFILNLIFDYIRTKRLSSLDNLDKLRNHK